MPPLRRRQGDIPVLARHFVEKVCRAEGIAIKTISLEAAERLAAFSWPGNVRQLENALEMAVALSGDRPVLDICDFPLASGGTLQPHPFSAVPVVALPESGMDYEQTLARIERSILEQALQKTGGNKKAAAEMLGLKRTTLCAKVRSLDTAGRWN
jgi:DNA-binding NtrC family response regulator